MSQGASDAFARATKQLNQTVVTRSVEDCCEVLEVQEETCDILICRKRNFIRHPDDEY